MPYRLVNKAAWIDQVVGIIDDDVNSKITRTLRLQRVGGRNVLGQVKKRRDHPLGE